MQSAPQFTRVLLGFAALALLAGCGSSTHIVPISVAIGPVTTVSLGGGGVQTFTATVSNDAADLAPAKRIP